jgi:hypothetical protein
LLEGYQVEVPKEELVVVVVALPCNLLLAVVALSLPPTLPYLLEGAHIPVVLVVVSLVLMGECTEPLGAVETPFFFLVGGSPCPVFGSIYGCIYSGMPVKPVGGFVGVGSGGKYFSHQLEPLPPRSCGDCCTVGILRVTPGPSPETPGLASNIVDVETLYFFAISRRLSPFLIV